MTDLTREERLVGIFVELADTLVADYEVVDLLQNLVDRCTELFDAAAAGILLFNTSHELELIASTDERSEFVGLMQLRSSQGPCFEAANSGKVISVGHLDAVEAEWPIFVSVAREARFASVHAIPMRLRDSTVGSLNLFRDHAGTINDADASAAQALADVATIGILQERYLREEEVARLQLQHALDSRVVIEQAKGYLAHTRGVDMVTAFNQMRDYARSHSFSLRRVATAIVEGTLEI